MQGFCGRVVIGCGNAKRLTMQHCCFIGRHYWVLYQSSTGRDVLFLFRRKPQHLSLDLVDHIGSVDENPRNDTSDEYTWKTEEMTW